MQTPDHELSSLKAMRPGRAPSGALPLTESQYDSLNHIDTRSEATSGDGDAPAEGGSNGNVAAYGEMLPIGDGIVVTLPKNNGLGLDRGPGPGEGLMRRPPEGSLEGLAEGLMEGLPEGIMEGSDGPDGSSLEPSQQSLPLRAGSFASYEDMGRYVKASLQCITGVPEPF